MILILDTETTGLPKNYKAPATDTENWPRLVQIAWRTYQNNGEEIDNAEYIISPNGFDIPDEAAALHGITTQRALDDGISLESALLSLSYDLGNADYVVAHNIAYDEKIVGAEFIRIGFTNQLEGKKTICTMLSSVNFCAISGPRGNKWPKLGELYQVLFAENLEGEHNAAVDCEAAAKCFWELVEKGVIVLKSPEVSVDEMFPAVANIAEKVDAAVMPVPGMSEWIEKEIAINDDLRKELQLEGVKIVEMSDEETQREIEAMAIDAIAEEKIKEMFEPGLLRAQIMDAYEGLDQTRMTLHHNDHIEWEAQRELDEVNYQLRQTDDYKACKNDPQRADYLYGNNRDAAHVLEIAKVDALGAKLDFQRASDRVERVRAILRVAELANGGRVGER